MHHIMARLLNAVLTLVVVYLFCLTGIASATSDNFYFTQHPKFPDKVVDGQSLSIPCQVSEEDHIVYHWLLNNQVLVNTTRRYQNRSSLVFDIVHRGRDAGQYQCVAQNTSSGYSLASATADITIGWMGTVAKVVMVAPKSKEELREGNSLTLQCVVEGEDFQVKWYRNAFLVLPVAKRVMVDERAGTLTITALSVSDNGVYSCEVVNEAGAVVSQKNFPLILTRPDIANARVIPQDVVVNKGAAAWFDCVYDDNARKVEWFSQHEQESPIKNSTKTGPVVFPNGTLYIPKVKQSDVGWYRCVGGIDYRDLAESAPSLGYVADLKIFEITRTSLRPSPTEENKYIQRAGSTLEVLCRTKTNAYPIPVLKWVNAKGDSISEGPYLIIESLQPSHAGAYICRAQNDNGYVSNYTVHLVVTILPIISQEPQTTTTVDEDSPVQLSCGFKGSPGPLTSIAWMRSPPQSTQYHKVLTTSRHLVTSRGSSSQLYINHSIAADDSGNYRCQVTTVGFPPVYSETAVVLIRERLKFTIKPLNQHLELDAKTKILCRAHATERVRIQWQRLVDGEATTEFPSHIRADLNGTLWFNGVRKTDEGDYVCLAETRSESLRATARVEVVVPPKFTVLPVSAVVFMGSTTRLDCQAVGDPIPSVQWDKEGRTNGTEPVRWRQLENGSIVLENVRAFDGGRYGCTAGNKGGFIREEIELTVQGESTTSVTQTIIITVSCASAYITLVFALVIYCKRKRSHKSASPETNPLTVLLTPEQIIPTTYSIPSAESTVLLPKQSRHPPSLASSIPASFYDRHPSSNQSRRTLSNQSHLYESAPVGYSTTTAPTSDVDPRYSPATSSAYSSAVYSSGKPGTFISPKQLKSMGNLGRGQFGEVFTATFQCSPCPLVAVKVLRPRCPEDVSAFSKEYSMYRKFHHVNVVQCLGRCSVTAGEPEWSVFEHTEAGNLKWFLQVNGTSITHRHRVEFLRQIALGMQHIAQHRYVHRDLAARNCVVEVLEDGELGVKVGNLSIMRDGEHDADYAAFNHRLLPLRWMPAEAVFEDEFSTKSDVWAYGVVCLEVLAGAMGRGGMGRPVVPYEGLSDGEVEEELRTERLRLVEDSEGFFEDERCLMERCTAWNPKDRPTFDEVLDDWQLSGHD